MTIKPFYQWKAEELAKSTMWYPREWYYAAYSSYCKKQRKAVESNE